MFCKFVVKPFYPVPGIGKIDRFQCGPAIVEVEPGNVILVMAKYHFSNFAGQIVELVKREASRFLVGQDVTFIGFGNDICDIQQGFFQIVLFPYFPDLPEFLSGRLAIVDFQGAADLAQPHSHNAAIVGNPGPNL
ncbi:hypothetical protein C8024_02730 [Sphingopyxis sp. BSNA05]|uniref:hypothetical protein n=1 Tax=Sphingopyxis sp. BSNA05 TaxID=1236614 RepID=UPI0015661DD5|nr:hypothetical protein [Sphingopyxis sp. BSNA05]NRD88612.1 hypothetical protein [Sphingopyxis sp. BSNA05]